MANLRSIGNVFQPDLPAARENAARWRPHDLGRMNVVCPHCGARFWDAELPKRRGDRFDTCCKNGAIDMHDVPDRAPVPEPPADSPLRMLLSENGDDEVGAIARDFRRHIHKINANMAFTSVFDTPDRNLDRSELNYIYQVQGTFYHRQGPLEPGPRPRFAQLLFLNTAEALAHRNDQLGNIGRAREILPALEEYFRTHNPYYHLLLRAKEVLDQNQSLRQLNLTPRLRLVRHPSQDRRYDLPISQANDEIAGFVPDIPVEYGEPGYRDLLIYLRQAPNVHQHRALDGIEHAVQDSNGRWLTRVHFEHPLYLPLQYVLFYMTGGRGYNRDSRLRQPNRSGKITFRYDAPAIH